MLISTGISTMALGFAIVVSVVAVLAARPVSTPLAGLPHATASFESFVPSMSSEVSHSRPERAPATEPPAIEPPATEPPSRTTRALRAADVVHVTTGRITDVNITFYDCADQGFCGLMYNGRPVYEGAAACSWNLPTGTKFIILGDPTGRVYSCDDRGLLSDTWVDIFWYEPSDGWRWQAAVGRYGVIEIVEVPAP